MVPSVRSFALIAAITVGLGSFQNCSNVDFATAPDSVGDGSNVGQDVPGGDGDGSGGDNTNDGGVDPGPQYETIFTMKNRVIPVRENSQVDILFVVDNSGSMSQEQAELANRIAGFMDVIKDLDWQIALTTTDARETQDWGNGKFRTFSSGSAVLKSGEQTLADAEASLVEAINVGTSGSGDERGINATFQAINRISTSEVHARFFRREASFAVILISDEDECSNGNCPGNQTSSVPENLVAKVRGDLGMGKNFAFHSIVKIPGDATCTTPANEGRVYQQMSQLTGGILGSICASSYASLLMSIGRSIVELVNSASLECPPADVDKDGKADIFVTLESGEMILLADLMIQGASLGFKMPLPVGTHQVVYHCAEKRLITR